jgi:hypothetical protein
MAFCISSFEGGSIFISRSMGASGIIASKEWITPETWKLIDERKVVNKKICQTHSERIKEKLRTKYTECNKKVKTATRMVTSNICTPHNTYMLQWSSPLSIDNNMVYLVLVPTIWRKPCQLMYFSMRENSTS